ncbi:sigma-70 family RNA polymerase sigma factor [Mucilaginibacter sp. PAMB04168]|uniref:RNA polymerase sigma factor n=1 Tax=Mucilaginibacter sp. PAMB04168 TaxID=3138567 RepID=UPI0031F6F4EC
MAYSSLSDANLWNLVIDDDYRAFTVLFQRHWVRLYKTALNYIKDEQVCEELIHNLFLNLWNRKRYLNINNFSAYLKVSLRYHVYAQLKKQKTSPIELQEDLCDTVYELNAAYEKLCYRDMEDELHKQMKTLPLRCQEIFKLSRTEQLSNTEIAVKLGISKRTVENQITVALKYIRGHIKDIAMLMVILLHW